MVGAKLTELPYIRRIIYYSLLLEYSRYPARGQDTLVKEYKEPSLALCLWCQQGERGESLFITTRGNTIGESDIYSLSLEAMIVIFRRLRLIITLSKEYRFFVYEVNLLSQSIEEFFVRVELCSYPWKDISVIQDDECTSLMPASKYYICKVDSSTLDCPQTFLCILRAALASA